MSGDVLNNGGNVEDQKYYGLKDSFFKIPPTVIYDITKNKLIKILLVNLISQRDKENINKELYEIHQIGENYEDGLTDDIEVLKLVN